MSLYGIQVNICGVPCAMVLRGAANGQYKAVFERERASLEEVEAIDWAQPVVEGDCILPAGYGFDVEEIVYSSVSQVYTVSLKVAEQFLGDVAGFRAQVDELTADVADKAATIQEQGAAIEKQKATLQERERTIQSQAETIRTLEAAGSAAQVVEQLEDAYQEGVESNG